MGQCLAHWSDVIFHPQNHASIRHPDALLKQRRYNAKCSSDFPYRGNGMPARTRPVHVKKSAAPRTRCALRPINDPARRLAAVAEILEANLGTPVWDGKRDGLQVLVLTILSQNTTDISALKGYTRLCETFPSEQAKTAIKRPDVLPRLADGSIDPVAIRLSQAADAFFQPDWNAVLASSPAALRDVIRPAGLPDAKEATIRRILVWLREDTGGFRLEDTLRGLSPVEAAAKLSSHKGIGPKTAAVTLIEACGIDLCPVDTHVHRIINRLGIVDTGDSRDKTYVLLQPMLPQGKGYALHHNLLTFGRTLCNAKAPRCGECFLRKLCPYGTEGGAK